MRIVSRVVIYNKKENKILLVRNKGKSYWYPAGGGWEEENEKIEKGAEREVFEEVGLKLKVDKVLYLREFEDKSLSKNKKTLEVFWLAFYDKEKNGPINYNHKDLDENGLVEEIKEFSQEELQSLKVFPEELKNKFWENLEKFNKSPNIFLKDLEE